jgi:hypothetical protein
MISKYTEEEINIAGQHDKLPLECEQCHKVFYSYKRYILDKRSKNSFCSFTCLGISNRERVKLNCKNCDKEIYKTPSQIKKTKNNVFCNKSCAAIYNNCHKKYGYRRSKLEIWIENNLTNLYPNLSILYNNKEIINSELDIYIPSLSLAFELNGIFHYEPIYGSDKLSQIKNNDNRKFQACLEKNIELCIINTSSFGYFKEEKAKFFLSIITNLINSKQ